MRSSLVLPAVAVALSLQASASALAKGPETVSACGAGPAPGEEECVRLEGRAAGAIMGEATPVAGPDEPGRALRLVLSSGGHGGRPAETHELLFVPDSGLVRGTDGTWSRLPGPPLAELRRATAALEPVTAVDAAAPARVAETFEPAANTRADEAGTALWFVAVLSGLAVLAAAAFARRRSRAARPG